MLGWYALAAALVCAYATAFPLWRAASASLGAGFGYVPIAAAAILVAVVVWRRRRISWWLLALGTAAAVAGLLLCDPRFPAKRIHVPEYFVLAIVLRLALRTRLSGIRLMFGSAALAALFGIYDELIQGLLPERTYGTSDIAVNALGALAGAATASAVRLFGDGRGSRAAAGGGFAFGAVCLAAGIVAFAVALGSIGSGKVPAWTVAPLAAGILAWLLTAEWDTVNAGLRHAGRVAVLLALGMSLYPLARPALPLNVIVLTMESARAEVLSPEIMPHVWAAAQSGTRFTQHRAVSAWTAANIVSLLTGASPFAHAVLTRGRSAELDAPPLRSLHARGWQTAGIQPFMLNEVFGGLGLDVAPAADPLPWMAAQAQISRPFLLWYHYLYTHLPYGQDEAFRPDWQSLLPPGDAAARARVETVMHAPAIPAGSVAFQPSDQPAIRSLYLGGFRAFDAWFARVWDFLDRSGLRSNTIVVLTADHGEELLERGLIGHASTTRDGHLHEEVVRIPLVIWLPERLRVEYRPAVVSQPTDHLDVMPTILQLLGEPAAGRNLFRPLEPRPWLGSTSRGGFAEDDPGHVTEFRHAEIEGDWKLMLATKDGEIVSTALYNLAQDPNETTDLVAAEPERAARLTADLMARATPLPSKPGGVVATTAGVAAPRIVWPPASGTYRYDDLAGRFRLEWLGRDDGRYVIQYEAGSGMLALDGELPVTGTTKDFGALDRRYWNTWVVPYGTFRVRVGVADRDDLWSDWLRITATR